MNVTEGGWWEGSYSNEDRRLHGSKESFERVKGKKKLDLRDVVKKCQNLNKV